MADATPTSAPEADAGGAERVVAGRIRLRGRTLRQHTARGTIINAGFTIALNFLALIRGFAVALFLSPDDYGIWGILIVSLAGITFLSDFGIGDKYIQQSESNQERAFQKAFTLNLLVSLIFTVILIAAVPIVAAVTGQPRVIAPGFVLILAVPIVALQMPLWVFYRQMDFVKERSLQAIDPIAGFVVTMALAIAGAGYWSLVIGTVAGASASALATLRYKPYRLGLKYDRGTLREYFSFSWPLFFANLNRMIVAQTSIFVGEWQLGLAAAGAITLTTNIANFANRVDAIVTNTLYPAVCAVRDRTELLFESFVKSNRLALMWGMPFGVGLALFAPDLVQFVLGHKWHQAVGLIQAFGLMAAANQIAFNWDAFFRAHGNTRPMAVVSVAGLVVYLVAALPLMVVDGLTGFALGMAASTAVQIIGRGYFLTRLFDGLSMLRHGARAIAPSVPPVVVLLMLRWFAPGERTATRAATELALYAALTVVATYVFERRLLGEMWTYVRGGRAARAAAA